MIKIAIFVTDVEKALEFYKKAFGLELSYCLKGSEEEIVYAVMTKEGEYFFAIVKSEKIEQKKSDTIQFNYGVKDKEKLTKLFEILKQNGKVEMVPQPLSYSPWAAVVVDQFGINWFLLVISEEETPEQWN